MRISDWSSDVCSSDLYALERFVALQSEQAARLSIAREALLQLVDIPPRRRVVQNLDGWLAIGDGQRVLVVLQQRRPGLRIAGDDIQPLAAFGAEAPLPAQGTRQKLDRQIGRASCRERVCQAV